MKKNLIAMLALVALLAPALASAHERQMFRIGGKEYLFVVGSLNEPIVVGDKTGVDLRIVLPDPADKHNASAPNVVPVTGLEKDLKVEVRAGGEAKVLDLKAAYGKPGSYAAQFYPTAATTYTYRVFGMINNTDVNLTFNCDPGGEAAESDNKKHNISQSVDRTYKTGGFGCPAERTNLEFPGTAPKQESSSGSDSMLVYAALALGAIGVGLGMRKGS